MSIRELLSFIKVGSLKSLLDAGNISHVGCVEKKELVDKTESLLHRIIRERFTLDATGHLLAKSFLILGQEK
jgi:hypothetical protein